MLREQWLTQEHSPSPPAHSEVVTSQVPGSVLILQRGISSLPKFFIILLLPLASLHSASSPCD